MVTTPVNYPGARRARRLQVRRVTTWSKTDKFSNWSFPIRYQTFFACFHRTTEPGRQRDVEMWWLDSRTHALRGLEKWKWVFWVCFPRRKHLFRCKPLQITFIRNVHISFYIFDTYLMHIWCILNLIVSLISSRSGGSSNVRSCDSSWLASNFDFGGCNPFIALHSTSIFLTIFLCFFVLIVAFREVQSWDSHRFWKHSGAGSKVLFRACWWMFSLPLKVTRSSFIPCWAMLAVGMRGMWGMWLLRFFHREHGEGFLPPGVAWWKLQQPSSGQWHWVPCDLQGLGTGVKNSQTETTEMQKCHRSHCEVCHASASPSCHNLDFLIPRRCGSHTIEVLKSFKNVLKIFRFLDFFFQISDSQNSPGPELAFWVHLVRRLELPLSSLWRESLVQRISRLS